MWKLTPGWNVQIADNELIFYSDIKSFRIKAPPEIILKLLGGSTFSGSLHTPDATTKQIVAQLRKLRIACNAENLDNLPNKSLQARYYFHQGIDFETASQKLSDARIMILGLGGTGSVVLEHLASTQICNFVLLDDDVVEFANLERQLIYGLKSIGRLKTEEACLYITERNKKAKVALINQRIESVKNFENILDETGHVDICIVCVDQPLEEAFSITSSVLWRRDIPFVHGGVMINSGFWGPVFVREAKSKSPENFCVWNKSAKKNNEYIAPSDLCFSPYNSIIGAYLARDVIRFLIGDHARVNFTKRSFMNFETDSIKTLGSA